MNEATLLRVVQESIREANDRKALKKLINHMEPDPYWKARGFLAALKRQGIDLETLEAERDDYKSMLERVRDFVADADPALWDAFIFGENVRAQGHH